MSSPKFERVKRSNPRLSDFLDRLVGYINSQIQADQPYIIPKLAATALHLKDAEAIVLLEILTKGDILQRIYNVYCRESNVLLATVDSIDALDHIPHCDDCDADHDPRDIVVQIAYKPKNGDTLGAVAK
jgi:uncharacterized FlgJ-related protein